MFVALNLGATNPPQPQQAETVQATEQVVQDSTIIIAPPPNGTPTVDWLFTQANGIYMLLLYLLGYLSGYIPFLRNLDDKRQRMLIIGLILAGAFAVWQLFQKDLNWQDFVGLAFAFIGTQITYQNVLSPIPVLKTPNPTRKGTSVNP